MRNDQVSTQIRINFGARVRELREQQGLSQYKFSAMIGMDRSYLIAVEKGYRNVSIDNIFKLAHGPNVSIADLFADVDSFVYEYISFPE